jgi:general secretion pathway protein K
MNNRDAGRLFADRGFALLLVLWTLVLLSLIGTRIAASGRAEAQLAANVRDAAVTQAAADGAIQEAVFHLLVAGDQHWAPSGRHRVALPGTAVEVGIENLAGRVNPNTASPELLRALLRALGVDSQRAMALADAIADWRTPGRNARPRGAKAPQYRAAGLDYDPPESPFRSVDELGAVLGMTPELLALLRPHLTLWWDDDPDPAFADPVVLAALRVIGAEEASSGDGRPGMVQVVGVTAEATGPHGSRFVRRAAVEIIPSAAGGGSWRLLDWDVPGP